MATRQTTFGKLERERAKRAKAAEKRARRQQRAAEDEGEETPASEAPPVSAESSADLLRRLEELHVRYDRGEIKFMDFEAQKEELIAKVAELTQ